MINIVLLYITLLKDAVNHRGNNGRSKEVMLTQKIVSKIS